MKLDQFDLQFTKIINFASDKSVAEIGALDFGDIKKSPQNNGTCFEFYNKTPEKSPRMSIAASIQIERWLHEIYSPKDELIAQSSRTERSKLKKVSVC